MAFMLAKKNQAGNPPRAAFIVIDASASSIPMGASSLAKSSQVMSFRFGSAFIVRFNRPTHSSFKHASEF